MTLLLRRIVRFFCITLLVGFCLLGLSLLVLPSLVESWMLPQLVQQLGYSDFFCDIDHLGVTETSAGPLRFGPGPKPGLTIERIHLLYDPESLAKGELDQVILSGISIRAVLNNGKISIPGLEKNPSGGDAEYPDKSSQDPSQLPILPFTTLTIERSVIIIKTDDREFRLPFSASIKKSIDPKSAVTHLDGTLQFNPRGTPIALNFSVTLTEKERAHLEVKANKIELLDFADILGRIDGLDARGEISLKAAADFGLMPLSLEKLESRTEWKQGKLTYNDFHIDNSQSTTGEDSTVEFSLNKENTTAPWKLQLNRLALLAPFSPTITNLEFIIKDEPDKIKLQGHWATRIGGQDKASGLTFNHPFTKKWRLTAAIDQHGGYQASLSSPAENHRWQLHNKTLSISGNSPAIKIQAHAQDSNPGEIDWLISLNHTVVDNAGKRLVFPEIKTAGRTKIKSSEAGVSSLPVTATQGSFTCNKIILNNTDLGRFNIDLQQQRNKFDFKGQYACKLIKELKFIINGECGFKPKGGFQTEAALSIPVCKPASPVILGKFIPAAGESTLDGTISATGKIAFGLDDTNQLKGDLTLNLNQAQFSYPEKNLTCSGINCRLKFPELPSLHTDSNQKLTFLHLQAGNINCKDGTFSFQFERDQTLLLEKGRIGWCGGNIETQALRFSPNINHYQSTLYCDRLNLSELLKQLGQIEARGQGSVNGRIPVAWAGGKIIFNDGFLYSTPNQTGNIKIKGGAALTAGIPTNSPQFAQLDLAREALKDYQYKWAKLKLNSAKKELILNLQFDGKPNLPLPFLYKKDIGSFVRISSDGPGSHFQGISLDINLRFPLNHILQYKGISTLAK